jgi:hypothetical protein
MDRPPGLSVALPGMGVRRTSGAGAAKVDIAPDLWDVEIDDF